MKSLALWQKLEYTDMNPGLGRIRVFLKEIGDPQECYWSVHIAGTNGKGSTAVMIASMLETAGYKTGLYTSPHLVSLNERMRVNSKEIASPRLEVLGKEYYALAKKFKLTFFEFITALAFIYFKEEKIDIAVLETGLGGRFDATNIIKRPAVTVITGIDYDHTDILGDSIAKIAMEKAGIIKEGCPVINGAGRKITLKVVSSTAKRSGSEIWIAGRDFKTKGVKTNWTKCMQYISYCDKFGKINIQVPLLGKYQVNNAGLAVAAARILDKNGFRLSNAAIKEGLRKSKWPGRFDVRRLRLNGKDRTIILDGAHNPGGIKVFSESFKESVWAEKPFNVIFGVLKDKDYKKIAEEILKLDGKVVIVPVRSARTIDVQDLRKVFLRIDSKHEVSVSGSLREALGQTTGTTVVVGSLYLVGEALQIIKKGEQNHG